MDANLFSENGSRSAIWVAARSRCGHVDPDSVLAAYNVVYMWYQLLIAAEAHVRGGVYRPKLLDEVDRIRTRLGQIRARLS